MRIGALLSLLFAAVASAGGPGVAAPPPAGPPPQAAAPLAVVCLTRDGGGVETVHLKADAGYIISWPKDRPPAFYVFDRARGTRERLPDWPAFLDRLRALPDGAVVDEVERCTVAYAWGMPDEKGRELDAVRAAKRFVAPGPDDPRHTAFCTCETRAVEILTGP